MSQLRHCQLCHSGIITIACYVLCRVSSSLLGQVESRFHVSFLLFTFQVIDHPLETSITHFRCPPDRFSQRPHQHFSLHCHVCGKGFSSIPGLAKHKSLHEGTQRYECVVCGKKFNCNQHYEGHMNTHRGVKPFQCRGCGKGFGYSVNLKRHERKCRILLGGTY